MKKEERLRVLSGVMAATMTGSILNGMPTVMAAKPDETEGQNPFNAVADTYVRSTDATTSFGSKDSFVLGSVNDIPAGINSTVDSTVDTKVAYLTFDISNLNIDNRFDDVSLVLKIANAPSATQSPSGGSTDARVEVYEAEGEVDEATANYQNKPKIKDKVEELGAVDNITSSDAVATVETDVNAQEIVIPGLGKIVKAAIDNNQTSITLAVYVKSGTEITVASREKTGSEPQLVKYVVDEDAINTAKDAINAFPEITLDNYKDESGEIARQRLEIIDIYNALTEAEKTWVLKETYEKFNTYYDDNVWGTLIGDFRTADELITDIKNIEKNAPITQESYPQFAAALDSIRSRYDAASFRAKAVIGNKNYQILVTAENKFNSYLKNDIEVVEEKISLLNDIDETNYLNLGKFVIEARESYDAFMDKIAPFKDVAAKKEDENWTRPESKTYYDEVEESLNESLLSLEDCELNVAAWKNATASAFVNAWNELKDKYGDDMLGGNPDTYEGRSKDLIEFEGTYYSNAANNLLSSVYYDDFKSGEVSEEVATAIEEYLCAVYLVSVDEIRAEYGEPYTDESKKQLSEDFKNRFNGEDIEEGLYIYLYTLRETAENAYADLSEKSQEIYSTESAYCDDVFSAMMKLVAEKLQPVFDFNVPEAELTKASIDGIKAAQTKISAFAQDETDLIAYLEKYSKYQYEQYRAKESAVENAVSALASLAADKVAEYDALIVEINSFALDYMSGYDTEVVNDITVGTKNDNPDYWNGDEWTVGAKAEAFAREAEEINKDEILEYYYDTMLGKTEAAEKKAALAVKYGEVDKCRNSFKEHNDTIVDLRSKASEVNDNLYNLTCILSESDIDRLSGMGSYEEAKEYIDGVIGGSVTWDELKGAFADAYTSIEDTNTGYRHMTEMYKTKYESEGFTNISEPYVSEQTLVQWDKYKEVYTRVIAPDEGLVETASQWAGRLRTLYEGYIADDNHVEIEDCVGVINLDPNEEYANGYSGVQLHLDNLEQLKADYDALGDAKYYIGTIYDSSGNVELSCALIESILSSWEDAKKATEMIDAADEARLEAISNPDDATKLLNTLDWITKLMDAERECGNLENETPLSYEKIASDALDKLALNRADYNIYVEFASWIETSSANDSVKEYAQLYKYNDDGELVESELSKTIDNLSAGAENMEELIESATDELGEYMSTQERYLKLSQSILKLAKEKAIALEAEELDKRIIGLDNLDGAEFAEELESLRSEIDAMVKTISDLTEEEKRSNDAAIKFGMLTQYAKYEEYVNNYDSRIADAFIEAVDAVGNITWTTNLSNAAEQLEVCNEMAAGLNDAQEKFAFAGIIKLEVLNKKYDRVRAARDGAQDIIAAINERIYVMDNAVLKADPYDYRFVALKAAYNAVISGNAEVAAKIDEVKGTDVYEYLVQNDHEGDFRGACGAFEDEHKYISVMDAITVLEDDMRDVLSFDSEGNAVIDEEARDVLIANTRQTLDEYTTLDDEQKQNVLNYSSLQWTVKNLDASRVNDILNAIDNLPSADDITYIRYSQAVNNIKTAYESLLSENQGRVQLANGGAQFDKFKQILVKMAILEEEYGELGGKSGDVNGDDIVDISDIILMVDYAFNPDFPANIDDEKRFIRANLVKESGTDSEKINFFDVAAVIDLMEFGN